MVPATIIADLHLHHLPSWRLHWCTKFITDFIKQHKEEPRHLYLLGDVFELRDKVDARILNLFLDMVLGIEDEVVWLTGQHDSFIPGHATLESLKAIDRIHVVDSQVLEFNGIWFVPFARDQDYYLDMLEQVPDGATVMTHVTLSEAIEQWGMGEKGIPVKYFERFEKVWSGDIHHGVKYANLEYLGAISQRDWRDYKVEGCLGFMDSSGDITRRAVTHPKHTKVTDAKQLRGLLFARGQQIIKICGLEVDPEHLAKVRAKHNFLEVEWEPLVLDHKLEQVEAKQDSDEEILMDYMKEAKGIPRDITTEELLEVGLELLGVR